MFRRFLVPGVLVSSLFLAFASTPFRAQNTVVSGDPSDAVSAVRGEPSAANVVAAGSAGSADAVELTEQGNTLVRLGLFEAAVPFFERSVKLLPRSAKAWLNLSILYDHIDRPSESLAAARKAVELDASDGLARRQVCDISVFAKQFGEAVSCYSELAKTAKLDDRMLANFGIAALGSGDLAKAAEILEPLASRQPYNAELQNAVGVVRFKQKNVPQAVAYFKRAIEISPDHGLFRYNMAVAQMQANNRAAVLSQYHLLEECDPAMAAKLRRYIFADKILVVGEK